MPIFLKFLEIILNLLKFFWKFLGNNYPCNAERKFQETLKNQEQRHSAEIRRLKSLQDTSNKLKQEKWVDEKTKRIKEQTVRGLEPEIQRLLARHNAEIADLEAERHCGCNCQNLTKIYTLICISIYPI